MAGRKRTGTLVRTGAGFSARFAGGPLIPLYTTDQTLAKARLRELAANGTQPQPGAATFREVCVQVCDMLERRGMATVSERRSRLERYFWPLLGDMRVTEIKPSQISEALAAAAATGLRHDTLHHLHTDVHVVFAQLVRDDVLAANPARSEKVDVPRAPRDRRRRTLLMDAEFSRFVSYCLGPAVPPQRRLGESRAMYAAKASRAEEKAAWRRQLAIMAIVSRCFGGLRPSDLHAWTWEDVDTLQWSWADAPRPKTEHALELEEQEISRERLELPQPVAAVLRDWWAAADAPSTGLVFPEQKHSYARDLRSALRDAGILRPELHTDTDRTRATDFYSFRRAFVTAVARSGLNAQTAMRTVGHRSMTTHQRYLVPEVLPIPASALPALDVAANDQSADQGAQPDPWEAALEGFDPTAATGR